ncbi:hypothetical protein QBZ16_002721 [Prototheca wickerhamii]|uniref:Uncharacterized protein n=1 Tax=Prototheca wickerhamii TaxID=3111 RepID=A0AAD9IJX0_PROWI|nr:hypothetical protein QBZ16_002721 [Prototheca wickerhamii]
MIERLPEKVAIDILAKAYLTSLPEDDGILVWSDYGGCNPLRTVVPLVCRSWNRLVQSPAAARVFFKRVRIVDPSILPLRKFRADAMLRWFQDRAQPYVQELEVDLSTVFANSPVLDHLSDLLADMIIGSPELRVLHLTGELNLGRVFERLPDAVREGALRRLRSLQVVYRLDMEGAPVSLPAGLALPPQSPISDELGALTGLVTLQLRRVPATCLPPWLGNLRALRHLYWDLSLPTDVPAVAPPGLERLTELRTLYLDTTHPLRVPETLRELRTLVLVGHSPAEAPDQDWAWLGALTKLTSLRIQGSAMAALPPEIRDMRHLRQLCLNSNHLGDVPPGPWLAQLERLHLGFNHFERFPPALRAAPRLEALHLGQQRARRAFGVGLARICPTLAFTRGDVRRAPVVLPEAAAAPPPRPDATAAGSSLHDFVGMQQRLRAHGKRLTSNDLAYSMDSVPVFNVSHIDWHGRDPSFVDL